MANEKPIGVRFDNGTKRRIDRVCDVLYNGITASDYIRQTIYNQLVMDENVLVNKGVLKPSQTRTAQLAKRAVGDIDG